MRGLWRAAPHGGPAICNGQHRGVLDQPSIPWWACWTSHPRRAGGTAARRSVAAADPGLAQEGPDPNSPRGRGLRAMMDLLEGSGDEGLETFLDERVSDRLKEKHGHDELLKMLRQVRADFAGAQIPQARAPVDTQNGQFVIDFTREFGDWPRQVKVSKADCRDHMREITLSQLRSGQDIRLRFKCEEAP